jgi:DNA-directed RNA polymerase
MNLTRQKIVDSINSRMDTELSAQNPVKILKTTPIDILVDTTISVTYLYTRNSKKKSILLSEVISAIGHGVRNKQEMKRDSSLAAKTGAFLLNTLDILGLISVQLGQSSNGHATYIITVLNEEALSSLWLQIPIEHTEKLPSLTPYDDWTSTQHSTGVMLVKTANRDVLATLKPETHPIVFNVVNRAQKVGWTIDTDIYELQAWALRNKTDAFSEIWAMQNPQAKISKVREAKAIGDIARRFLDKTFYHLYYLDFRGRKYVATAYLHEQGCDLSKGLLRRKDRKKITEQGFFWLMVAIANTWAGSAGREDEAKTDKIPLNDRVYWALDNEEILLSYAENPKVNVGWMKADKPWQFISACFELKRFRDWQKLCSRLIQEEEILEYDYLTNFEAYIDGSTNGSQHLSALTKDEITAPLVNLVPLDLPGDLYTYVGDHVWESLEKLKNNLTKEEILDCEAVIEIITMMKQDIQKAELKSELRKNLIEALRMFRNENLEVIKKAAVVFWLRITDAKHKRKICKRNTMTIAYGASAYGMGSQQAEDARKHGIDQLTAIETQWATFMGRAVYDDCKISLKRPMRLLSVFEEAGRAAEDKEEFLSWTVPITNFPAVQHYTEGKVKKIWVQYGAPVGKRLSTGRYENTYQLAICHIEEPIYSKRKQAQGASPNAIHSLDAAHLMLTVNKAEFPITTIHDSFGALLPDLPELFILIRETFVELYEADPLIKLMEDINGDISQVEIGNLDIKNILDSEYAFA